MNNMRGFTLLELLIVMAIAAILITIASVQANQWIIKAAVESEAAQLYGEIMNTRQAAMNLKRPRAIVVKPTSFQVYSTLTTSVGAVGYYTLRYSVLTGSGLVPSAGRIIRFDERGYVSNADNVSLCVEPSGDTLELNAASYDSVVVSELRTRLGKRTTEGAECNNDNIQLK